VSEIQPFLAQFGQGFVAQAMGYFVVVGLLYLVFWRWGAQRFASARVMPAHRAATAADGSVSGQQIRTEVKNSLIVMVTSSPLTLGVSMLYASGHTRLTTDAASIGWLGIVATFVGLLIFNDAWFYAWHRLLHHPKLFARVHAVHHKSVNVNPFSSYSFHWFEGMVLGGWILPVALLVPIYLPMLGAMHAIGLANNVMSHLGYELFPRGLIKVPGLRWINTATFHSLHHTSSRGNFGLMFRFWDRMLGTELPNYEQAFVNRGATRAPASNAAP
jgi:Delta7-sterol 5-desaturase